MATHDPWDGTGWDITSPDIGQPVGNHYKEMYDLRKGVAIRANKEHVTYAASSAGGEHKNGSAVAYEGTSTPTNRPDGSTALGNNAYDRGRLLIDDNYDLPVLKRWTGSAFEVVTAHIVHATSCVLELENLENANTDGAMDSIIKIVGCKDAAGDCDLAWIRVSHDGTGDDQKGKVEILVNDGDDDNTPSKTGLAIGSDQLVEIPGALSVTGTITGGASSDIAINTDKVTIEAATGNTAVAGTLGVTGVATVAKGSLLASSDAPTTDAMIANKKYVDDQLTAKSSFGSYTTEDDDSNTLLKAHAYKANQDGIITARVQVTTGQTLNGFIGATTDPAGAGDLVQQSIIYASGNISITFPVASGKYWEVTTTSSNAVTIYWHPCGTLIKCTDQD